jgi:hypothetical protein
MTAAEIVDATRRAFDRFLDLYAQVGQHLFHGSADYHDARTYRGPTFWSEADCVYRFALELEKEFPGHVHLGFELSASTLYAFEKADRGEVDLAVSDLSDFEADDTSHRRFGTRKHELFVEAKYLPKGHWPRDVKKKIDHDIPANVTSQLARLRAGRCESPPASSWTTTTTSSCAQGRETLDPSRDPVAESWGRAPNVADVHVAVDRDQIRGSRIRTSVSR